MSDYQSAATRSRIVEKYYWKFLKGDWIRLADDMFVSWSEVILISVVEFEVLLSCYLIGGAIVNDPWT